MSGSVKRLDKTLAEFLELKGKYDLDDDKFLLLLGMVNLMGIINMLEDRNMGSEKGVRSRRPPFLSESHFMGMFTGPKVKQQQDL